MKIQITADSTIDLSKELYEKYDIAVIPFVVTLGDETFLDGETIAPSDIYKFVAKTGKLPMTGARSPEDMKAFFESFTSKGIEVVHIGIGSQLSSGFGYATVAAKDNPLVHLVDTQTLSSGSGLLAIYASELNKMGIYSAKEIAEKARKRAFSGQSSFIVEKLKFLFKGGRCSMISMLGANLMHIKPCIQVVDGVNKVTRKYIGNMPACVAKYVEETLKIYDTPDLTRCMITYSTATPEMVKVAKETVAKLANFREVLVTQAGSVINSHCGENTIGILYLNDGDGDHYAK
jgi:DegV family protein with EDD domain